MRDEDEHANDVRVSRKAGDEGPRRMDMGGWNLNVHLRVTYLQNVVFGGWG